MVASTGIAEPEVHGAAEAFAALTHHDVRGPARGPGAEEGLGVAGGEEQLGHDIHGQGIGRGRLDHGERGVQAQVAHGGRLRLRIIHEAEPDRNIHTHAHPAKTPGAAEVGAEEVVQRGVEAAAAGVRVPGAASPGDHATVGAANSAAQGATATPCASAAQATWTCTSRTHSNAGRADMDLRRDGRRRRGSPTG